MIRIDEIYENVFLPQALKSPGVGLHWFDPFGSTDIRDIVNLPPLAPLASKRIIFWDQEPVHLDNAILFLDQFFHIYHTYNEKATTIITSEKNSKNVEKLCEKYDLNFNYYFFHAWAALDWYRGYNRTLLYRIFPERSISHTFMCPNNIIGGERRHRIELLRELVRHNLISGNLISFPAVCPYENISLQDLCKNYQIDFDYSSLNLPLVIDHRDNHHHSSHRIDLWGGADKTLLQVVTETVFYGQRQHLTEKTFKPIVMQQPFVLVSCRGSLEYLRSYGFQTFGDFWNESYDDLDDHERIAAIGTLLADLDGLSSKEKTQMQYHLWPVVKHNFDWFNNREFENLLWQELSGMISSW
jgi:hypothetical protein